MEIRKDAEKYKEFIRQILVPNPSDRPDAFECVRILLNLLFDVPKSGINRINKLLRVVRKQMKAEVIRPVFIQCFYDALCDSRVCSHKQIATITVPLRVDLNNPLHSDAANPNESRSHPNSTNPFESDPLRCNPPLGFLLSAMISESEERTTWDFPSLRSFSPTVLFDFPTPISHIEMLRSTHSIREEPSLSHTFEECS